MFAHSRESGHWSLSLYGVKMRSLGVLWPLEEGERGGRNAPSGSSGKNFSTVFVLGIKMSECAVADGSFVLVGCG